MNYVFIFMYFQISAVLREPEANSRGSAASTQASLGQNMTNTHFNQVLTNGTSQLAQSWIGLLKEQLIKDSRCTFI